MIKLVKTSHLCNGKNPPQQNRLTCFSLDSYELRNTYNVRKHEQIIHRYFIDSHAVFMS